ncbi:unnamed protein product [Lactuca virosa]|uniref:Uncharacterized protein n=1 Tax=Lactuca virosa TaxID=75947 RepID=A0AAU9MZC2_9ASTR|nr:unnamed protein product [Lactuca virosa]
MANSGHANLTRRPTDSSQRETLRRCRLKEEKEKGGGFFWSLSSAEQQQRWHQCLQQQWRQQHPPGGHLSATRAIRLDGASVPT